MRVKSPWRAYLDLDFRVTEKRRSNKVLDVGLELRDVGANYPFEGRANSRESSRIPATETVRVLSCGCNSGLNIREDSRTIAFDIYGRRALCRQGPQSIPPCRVCGLIGIAADHVD